MGVATTDDDPRSCHMEIVCYDVDTLPPVFVTQSSDSPSFTLGGHRIGTEADDSIGAVYAADVATSCATPVLRERNSKGPSIASGHKALCMIQTSGRHGRRQDNDRIRVLSLIHDGVHVEKQSGNEPRPDENNSPYQDRDERSFNPATMAGVASPHWA